MKKHNMHKVKRYRMDIKPITAVARRFAKKSFKMSTFNMSEGYEVIRTCHDDTVIVCYNPTFKGVSWTDVNAESAERGFAFLSLVANELTAAGYEVTLVDNFATSFSIMVKENK